jgi:hypothetical protein
VGLGFGVNFQNREHIVGVDELLVCGERRPDIGLGFLLYGYKKRNGGGDSEFDGGFGESSESFKHGRAFVSEGNVLHFEGFYSFEGVFIFFKLGKSVNLGIEGVDFGGGSGGFCVPVFGFDDFVGDIF